MKSAYWYCIFRSFFLFCLPPKLGVILLCHLNLSTLPIHVRQGCCTWWSSLFIPVVNFGLGNFIIFSCFLILSDHSDILNLVVFFLVVVIFSNTTFQVTKDICVGTKPPKFLVTQVW